MHLAGRGANAVLLGLSLLFYGLGEGAYLSVMLAAIAFAHGAGRLIAAGRRRAGLALGVGGTLALLGWFKYAGFAAQTLGAEIAAIHLPLGISFFTFQAIAYVVDVSRGTVPAERSALRLATYIAMFPQLVAGPIVRFGEIAGALRRRHVDLAALHDGFGLFATGLAAKVLIADTLAVPADAVFAETPGELRADAALLGVAAYTLQIYYDFLGYSAMAVGLGLALGFRLPRNFDHPYAARSLTEFWRRWHITLSTWFRDYLYIPLGGNRAGPARTYRNLWIVFLATGLWHGAAWTFVLWGAWHGAVLTLERAGLGRRLAARPALGLVWTLAAVALGWVLFRADDLAHAAGVYAALLRPEAPVPAAAHWSAEVGLALLAGALLAGPRPACALGRWVALPTYARRDAPLRARPVALALVLFAGLTAASILKLLAGGHSPFIYFRF